MLIKDILTVWEFKLKVLIEDSKGVDIWAECHKDEDLSPWSLHVLRFPLDSLAPYHGPKHACEVN